jgi:3-methyladenine DNA glycosylase AlkC
MAERLKDRFFTDESVNTMAEAIAGAWGQFDKEAFVASIFTEEFEGLELKAKMRYTTQCLNKFLPEDYREALAILKEAAPGIKGFEAMSMLDYVELYGMDDWEASLPALRFFTRFASGEFAIRPFIVKDPRRAMDTLLEWAEDQDEKVRRLASEGCRPRLPWAMALPEFQKDPSLILPVLEKLKRDPSDFVRRSVANNLNDISKDHPDVVLDLCSQWQGMSPEIDQIIKHACRTLLKSGNTKAMRLFGYGDPANLHIKDLSLDKEAIVIGGHIYVSFNLDVRENADCKVRLEFAVHYMKAKGNHSKKVFQIIEKTFTPGVHPVKRKLSFADISTRKHYPGPHPIAVMVNGEEKARVVLSLETP